MQLVSVIIPAYNHEKYVTYTIESIINQSYSNIELLIINDGSTDNTHQKIEQLLPKCKQRFVNTFYKVRENKGIIDTLNELIAAATGEYIYLIASDDCAEPNAIKIQEQFLTNNKDYGLVVGDNNIIDENNKKCFWDQNRNNVYDKNQATYYTFVDLLKKNKNKFTSDNFGSYFSLIKGNYIPNGYMIRKQLLLAIGGYSKKGKLEDYYIMLQLAKITKFKYIDEPLFSYRWHSNNTIKQTHKMRYYFLETQFNELLNNLNNFTLFKLLIKNRIKYYIFTLKNSTNELCQDLLAKLKVW